MRNSCLSLKNQWKQLHCYKTEDFSNGTSREGYREKNMKSKKENERWEETEEKKTYNKKSKASTPPLKKPKQQTNTEDRYN